MGAHVGPADWWTEGTDRGRHHIATNGVLQTGLIYNLDASTNVSYPGSGVTWSDIEGNHNITLTNGPTFSSVDNYGGFAFDGTNDYGLVTGGIPLASPISLTNNFSIEQVFKPTGYQVSTFFGLANMLALKGSSTTFNYATQVTSDTSVSFIKRTSPEGLQFNTFTVPSMQNNVNIVTFVVKNGNNTAIDTVECYVNGSFISSQSIAGLAIAAVDNEPFYVGGLNSQQYTSFIGSYYSLRIYNRSLSEIEIKQNFNALKNRFSL